MVTKKKAKKKVAKKVAPKLRQFVFTGDPVNGDDPPSIKMFGKSFILNGKPVSVSDEVANLISGNNHFTEK